VVQSFQASQTLGLELNPIIPQTISSETEKINQFISHLMVKYHFKTISQISQNIPKLFERFSNVAKC
jgi:hypothetical protein